ncbi:hypothetical protein Syun_005240 [Stephania yunnanensis]|uniref:TF-B3 domain-containing protein n=1 Tax=Stephania yunnanensis TaxID=152371 RepID=A0AAP0L4F4_9MAGN
MRKPPLRSPAIENHPHFFKIIHSGFIHEGRLRIPTKFMSNFPNKLSDVGKLIVPGGKIWNIRLKRDSTGMWFEQGLQEFIKYYSMSAGHLLLFRYDGNSKFQVTIFDMTATEIGYPCSNAAVDGSGLREKKGGPKTYNNRNPILKCKEEQVEYEENAAKPFAGKATSQFEKRRTGKLKITEPSDGDTVKTREDDDIIETSEDTETLETSEDDAAAETSEYDDVVEMSEDDTLKYWMLIPSTKMFVEKLASMNVRRMVWRNYVTKEIRWMKESSVVHNPCAAGSPSEPCQTKQQKLPHQGFIN